MNENEFGQCSNDNRCCCDCDGHCPCYNNDYMCCYCSSDSIDEEGYGPKV